MFLSHNEGGAFGNDLPVLDRAGAEFTMPPEDVAQLDRSDFDGDGDGRLDVLMGAVSSRLLNSAALE